MSENNLITNDLVENIFYSFYDKKDIKLILKEIYSFFRENEYSNIEIKRALQYYLWQRKDYIYLEYDLRAIPPCHRYQWFHRHQLLFYLEYKHEYYHKFLHSSNGREHLDTPQYCLLSLNAHLERFLFYSLRFHKVEHYKVCVVIK